LRTNNTANKLMFLQKNKKMITNNQSVLQIIPEAKPRKLKKVPYVELAMSRLQGVVSSGSDVNRVYVSFIASKSFDYYCSTNNNRPCGGLRGNTCKHLDSLIKEAILQYGANRVAAYLGIPFDAKISVDARSISNYIRANGQLLKEPAGTVFSRFLNHLRYLELEKSTAPNPDMDWFISSKND